MHFAHVCGQLCQVHKTSTALVTVQVEMFQVNGFFVVFRAIFGGKLFTAYIAWILNASAVVHFIRVNLQVLAATESLVACLASKLDFFALSFV